MFKKVSMRRISNFYEFVGDDVVRLFLKSSIPGFLWFFVEIGFVFIMQGFLFALGVLDGAQVNLPKWWPTGVTTSFAVIILYGTARAGVQFLRQYLSAKANQVFMANQKRKILEYAIFNANDVNSDECIVAFNDLVSATSNLMQNAVMILTYIVSSFCLTVAAARIAPIEFSLGMTILSIIIYPLQRLNRYIGIAGENLTQSWQLATSTLLSGVKNNFLLSAYNTREAAFETGAAAISKIEGNYRIYSLCESVKNVIPMFWGMVTISIVALVSVKFIKTESMALISFFYLFMRIAQSGGDLQSAYSNIKLSYPSFKILYMWHLKLKAGRKFKLSKSELTSVKAAWLESILNSGINIDVQNISFGYEPRDRLLQDINATISPGNPLIIKGPSGSGKSTLLSILLGINSPNKGKVLVNGAPIEDVRSAFAPYIGYVGPSSFFIPGTVRDNLMYPNNPNNHSDQELWTILALCKIDDVIKQLNGGLDTYLTELTPLSTGQKQRLSMAAALLRNPKLLILDEATANLDPETERHFLIDLEKISRKIAMVIVSHKRSFDCFRNARELVVGPTI